MDNKQLESTPLGAKPDFIAIPERNTQLAEAIIRYCQYIEYGDNEVKHYQLIKRWAVEITGNCDTQIKILEEFKRQ